MNEEMLQRDEHWMRRAIVLAQRAADLGEVPVGAVLVDENNHIVGEGFNTPIADHDPSAHAEMNALRQAAAHLRNYRVVNTTLYVTLEPCAMCAGLIVHSRVARVVFGAWDEKSGAGGSVMDILQHPALNHQVDVTGGVLSEQCSQMLSAFFRQRRQEKKQAKLARQAKTPGQDQ